MPKVQYAAFARLMDAVVGLVRPPRRHVQFGLRLRQLLSYDGRMLAAYENTLSRMRNTAALKIAAAGSVTTQAVAIGFISPQLV